MFIHSFYIVDTGPEEPWLPLQVTRLELSLYRTEVLTLHSNPQLERLDDWFRNFESLVK